MDHSIWEVIAASFALDIWQHVGSFVPETLYMVALSSTIMLFCGLSLRVLLAMTNPDGLVSLGLLYANSKWLTNCLRSLPQMIMIILMIPVTRLFFGKSYGTDARTIATAVSYIPMYARAVESSLLEIARGKVKAAKSIGSINAQVILHILLPEIVPSLIRGSTVVVVAVVSMTALAGMFGAGGIGDIAVRFDYQRFQHDVLFAAVHILVIPVQLAQWVGDLTSKQILKRRSLIQNLSISWI